MSLPYNPLSPVPMGESQSAAHGTGQAGPSDPQIHLRSGPAQVNAPVRSPSDLGPATLCVFVLLVTVNMAFVIALLMLTKCTHSEAVITAVKVTGSAALIFYSRNAIVTIGRRFAIVASNSPPTAGRDS